LQNIKCGIGKLIEFPENSNLIKQKIDWNSETEMETELHWSILLAKQT
jgi:hypothetical protein